MTTSLESLVGRLRAGVDPEESARRLDALLRPRLGRYFLACGASPGEIEDLVQETLLRVFRHVENLRAVDRFVPWLFTIARNVGRSAAGRRHPQEVRDLESVERTAAPAPDATAESEGRERMAAVQRGIATLPVQQRRCLILVVRDRLSYREAGRLLGLSELTVRNHLTTARRRLRQMTADGEDRR